MKNTYCILVLALMYLRPVSAATIETALFSIDVPDQWNVEDNKASIILVMGDRIRDRMPMPFLSIQYCTLTEPPADSDLRRCNDPCSKKSLSFLTDRQPRGVKLSPIAEVRKPNRIVEYSTESASSPNGGVAFATLSCSSTGQVYVSLVSDEPKNDAKAVFNSVVESIKWKL